MRFKSAYTAQRILDFCEVFTDAVGKLIPVRFKYYYPVHDESHHCGMQSSAALPSV